MIIAKYKVLLYVKHCVMNPQKLLFIPAALLGSVVAKGQAEEAPNFLFISSDDLCSAMHAFGDPRRNT